MAILGTLLKRGIILRESFEQLYASSFDLQKQGLRNLLIHCRGTKFGKKHSFDKILMSFNGESLGFYEKFKNEIPIFDYNRIYSEWWHMTKEGQKDVCWPGKVKYFALSSGTSGSPSKYIPITRDMMKSIRSTSMRQILTMGRFDLPTSLFSKGILMLGGSTNLKKNGHYFEGDLSGIATTQIPFWFQHFCKPGKKIAKTQNWSDKLDEIVKSAPTWDIGIIVGVPAWMQILIERILVTYNLETIHDIWPNLQIFVHGGVTFEPYKRGFEKLLARPLHYIETYLASEGFIAFQTHPNKKSMRLILNNGIFYEFVPFTKSNFDEEGKLRANAKTFMINEIEEDKEYALLITTNAGAWRYIIEDVIKFTSLKENEIVITGRTKLFMNLCGEHLSLDNMNKVIELIEEEMKMDIREFTLLGDMSGSLFSHHWYIGTDDEVDCDELIRRIDYHLMNLNDDYKVERGLALKELKLSMVPTTIFYKWMEEQDKVGSQNKFPRVLKKEKAQLWENFLVTQNIQAN